MRSLLLLFLAAPAFGQRAPAYRAPRAPDGHPDLSGVWQTIGTPIRICRPILPNRWKLDPEAIHGSISDDLADIWTDLKRGVLLLRKDDASNAICEWRFAFLYHWGPHHAIHLLRPLFALAFSEELEP